MIKRLARGIGSDRTSFIIVCVWMLVGFFSFGFAGEFDKVQKNDYISYLPGSSESVKALNEIKQFPSGESIGAIIVFERDSGLSAKDRREIADFSKQLKSDPPPYATAPEGPVYSKDDTTAIVLQNIKIPSDGDGSDQIKVAVKDLLDRTAEIKSGMTIKVTGGAGISYDSIQIFNGINSVLLLAAASLVFVLLILIYRSPIFWFIPFFTVLFAEGLTRGLGYLLAEAGLTINGQSAGILSVLVFGAGTDYALLLVSRYREELAHFESRSEAIKHAVERAAPAITASAGTVIAGLLCLTFAEVNGTRGLGPIGSVGIAVAMMAMITLLPALLRLFPREVFYPKVPHPGDVEKVSETRGFWHNVGEKVQRRPRLVSVGMICALGVCMLGLTAYNTNLTQAQQFTSDPQSIQGQKLVSAAFPAGLNAPTDVVVGDAAKTPAVVAAIKKMPDIASVTVIERGKPGVHLSVALNSNPYSATAYELIPKLRKKAKEVGGTSTLVGGPTAIEADLRTASERDSRVIPPIVLIVVFLILAILLRALVASFILILTVLLSFGATLGLSALVFKYIFDFPGSDPGLLLFAFIFLVALGVDYNIFLMARAREESKKFGTQTGMLRALSVTGAVITSAGIVLAGTFSVLATLPLVTLTQIGFTVALGVLLDTFLVRSILVPALSFDLGDRIWWPKSKEMNEATAAHRPEPEDPPRE